MNQKLIINKNGNLRGIQIELSPAEALVILDALRNYGGMVGVHEDDKKTARDMRNTMIHMRVRCEKEDDQDERSDQQSRVVQQVGNDPCTNGGK